MTSVTFELADSLGIIIAVTEMDDGTLHFTVTVDETAGQTADINALYFDLSDDSMVDGLTVTGADVTDENFAANKVTKIDSHTNMNGEIVNEYGKFDGGIQFGTQGIATDDIQSTSFVLSHDSVGLTIDDILAQDFGIRLTSVGEIDGPREDSLKIGGTAPDTPDQPPEPELVNTANADSLIVFEGEAFETDGSTDALTTGAISVLENDTTFDGADAFVYNESVASVNGDTNAIAQIVNGDNGGQLIVYADGTVDFSSNGDFDALSSGQTEVTNFTYEIEGGSTAIIDVTVLGEDLGFLD